MHLLMIAIDKPTRRKETKTLRDRLLTNAPNPVTSDVSKKDKADSMPN